MKHHKRTISNQDRSRELDSIGDFNVNSGIEAVVDENVEMVLDQYGLYKAIGKTDDYQPSRDRLQKLLAVNAMSDESPNEDEVAAILYKSSSGMKHDPDIGYYLDLYAGHVMVGDYRAKASSGGITTWLLVKLLENKLIDGVIHVKEAHDGDGILFKYALSTTVEEIRAGAKSRYYPAELSNPLKEVKVTGGKYAITGIPSIIFELRLLALQDPAIDTCIAFTFGLICGHQKSSKYTEALAWQHGIKPGHLKSIDYRKKSDHGLAQHYLTEMTGYIDGRLTTITKTQPELFVSDWGHGFFKAKLSDFTDDALNETADIALGDAWLDEYVKDAQGNNVLIVRNHTINQILKDGIKKGEITLDSILPSVVIRSQSGLINHARRELPYRLYQLDSRQRWRPKKRLPASNNFPWLRKRVQNLRQRISARSHVIYAQAVDKQDWSYFEGHMQRLTIEYDLIYKYSRLRQRKMGRGLKKLAISPIATLKSLKNI